MEAFIRENIKNLEAYRVEPPHYEIILNANESPYDFPMVLKRKFCDEICNTPLNRYPDACFDELLMELSHYTGVEKSGIICGSGSDEIIAMIHQAFINPGDVVLSHTPSFAMYDIWSTISDAKHVQIPDLENHIPNIEGLIEAANQQNAKLLYLCNPNNPTGFTFSQPEIIKILDNVPSLVVLDEAYIEFFEDSGVSLLNQYPNLLILRTLSKAFGLAGIRCGYALGNTELINVLYKVKGPYNLNVLTQKLAVIALQNKEGILKNLQTLKDEREGMMAFLEEYDAFKVSPSGSNFIYFETVFAEKIYNFLREKNILIKVFKDVPENSGSIRLSIGTPQENAKLINLIKEVMNHESPSDSKTKNN
ncbi:MAG: histidinol-phosphate transaminase [Eubacteriaceae bacterium]